MLGFQQARNALIQKAYKLSGILLTSDKFIQNLNLGGDPHAGQLPEGQNSGQFG